MLQLIGFMYIPGILGNNIWDGEAGRMTATVVAFSINYACYFSVIYRGGIQGVPAGQREAAEVLGLTKQQIFFKVTLLQMIKRIVPPCPTRSSPWSRIPPWPGSSPCMS